MFGFVGAVPLTVSVPVRQVARRDEGRGLDLPPIEVFKLLAEKSDSILTYYYILKEKKLVLFKLYAPVMCIENFRWIVTNCILASAS